MYRQLGSSHDNVLGFQFSGTITEREAGEILEQLDELIRREQSVCLLVKLPEEPDSTSLAILNQRLRFFRDHAESIERYALVTGRTLSKWATKAANVLAPMEVRPYGLDQEEAAWRWLESGEEPDSEQEVPTLQQSPPPTLRTQTPETEVVEPLQSKRRTTRSYSGA